MRLLFAVALLLYTSAIISAQSEKEPDPRYGVKPRLKQYPQNTPRESLKSALAAMDKGDYSYLVAHLLDPKFVDDAVTERTKLFEATAEVELAKLRDFQRANPDRVAKEDRVPFDQAEFRARVAVRAREMAYKQLVKDVAQKFADDPQVAKDFRRFLTNGTFNEAAPAATATHTGVKNRTLYFKNIDNRWFLENRQTEEKKSDDK